MSRLPLYGTQGKFTFRLLAMALLGQAVILSFFALVARGIAIADGRPEDGDRLLWVGMGLAVLAVVVAGLMRRPYGITLGWVVQVLTWASALLVTAMIGVAVVFTALWVLLLLQGGTVDRVVAEREAAQAETAATAEADAGTAGSAPRPTTAGHAEDAEPLPRSTTAGDAEDTQYAPRPAPAGD